MAGVFPFLFFIPFRLLAHGIVAPAFRAGLSPLVSPLWKTYPEVYLSDLLGDLKPQ